MHLRALYQFGLSVMMVLFFTAQSFALSHNAEFGNGPHEHDGVVCEVSLASTDEHVIVPELPSFERPENTATALVYTIFQSADHLTPPAQAPPPRAPPHLTA